MVIILKTESLSNFFWLLNSKVLLSYIFLKISIKNTSISC